MKKYRLICLLLSIAWIFCALCGSVAAWGLPGDEPEPAGTSDGRVSPSLILEPNSQTLPTPQETVSAPGIHPQAKAALLIELNSNTIVYSLNPDTRVYPASLTKIMTCILALEYGKPDDLITVTDTSLLGLDWSGSTANLEAGEQMTLENMLYCMMLSSANEACNVVAEHFCDDIDVFVERMNEKAAALGCTGTHFANTHGLHDENHYTTARDISIIARYAWQNELFRKITSTATYTVPATNLSEPRELHSTNYLIDDSYTAKYYYDKAAGIKTGFTTPAGGCLVSTAKDENLEFLSVVCGCDEVAEADGSYTDMRFTETEKLFEYGFESFSYVQILSSLDMVADVPVSMAAGRADVVLRPLEDHYTLLPSDYNPTDVTVSYTLDGTGQLEAPIAQDQVVGTVTAFYQGQEVGTSPLSAVFAVPRSNGAFAASQTKGFLARFWWLIVLVLVVLAAASIIWASRSRRRRKLRRAARRARQNRNQRRDRQ